MSQLNFVILTASFRFMFGRCSLTANAKIYGIYTKLTYKMRMPTENKIAGKLYLATEWKCWAVTLYVLI